MNHQVRGEVVKYWRAVLTEGPMRWNTFPLFPLVLNADGSLWEPACLWLLDRARAQPLKVSSLPPLARDLKDYKIFLDGLFLAWDNFLAVDKYARPTYLYRSHLQTQIDAGMMELSTARRRMSSVVSFYRYLMSSEQMRFIPANDPWVDRQYGFQYRDSKGFNRIHEVQSTNLSIRVPKADHVWEGIIDGGRLRPLTADEQRSLIAGLKALGNREFELMHYVSLFTGAREQTALTLRWGPFQKSPSQIKQWPFKLLCGPGTGIDTKRDVPNVYLAIPRYLYEWLHVYARSERAQHRRSKSERADHSSNYLFLTSQGGPYYAAKDDINAVTFSSQVVRRSAPIGQGLREFILERVVPEVRRTLPGFRYRFHDLRATFGMNWVDHVESTFGDREAFFWAREQLRKLMWHRDPATTDRYLEFRQRTRQLAEAQADWGNDLLSLIQKS